MPDRARKVEGYAPNHTSSGAGTRFAFMERARLAGAAGSGAGAGAKANADGHDFLFIILNLRAFYWTLPGTAFVLLPYTRMTLVLCHLWAKARYRSLGVAVSAAAGLAACSSAPPVTAGPSSLPPPPAVMAVETRCTPSFAQSGVASWYGDAFQMKATASGEPFDMDKLTAAHRWLPLNTIVRVTNLRNGRSVVLRINDRGPYVRGRVLDVSRYAAQQLGMARRGVAPVRIEVFDLGRETKPRIMLSEAEAEVASGPPAERHFPPVGAVAEQR